MNNKMKIGFFGDSIWAQNTLLELLKNKNYEVMFVVPRFNNPDKQLIFIAEKNHIPVFYCKNVNHIEFIEKIKSQEIDLNVSMSFDQIIKKDLLEVAPKGFINCHAGALPFYRGRNILNWALINGETSFGITVHYIDEGIDTGDIIQQYIEPILITDTYNDLLEKCYDLCPKVLMKAIEDIYLDKIKRIKQSDIHPIGFYCGKRVLGDEIINWNWDSERIYNFIRAITLPGPTAQTYLKGNILKIVKASIIPQAPSYIGTPGEIVGRSMYGNIVKTGDSTILLEKVIIGNDSIQIPQFPIGVRLK